MICNFTVGKVIGCGTAGKIRAAHPSNGGLAIIFNINYVYIIRVQILLFYNGL